MNLLVSLFERTPRQERIDPADEVGALEDVLVRAGQAMGDRGACHLSLGDPLLQLGELARYSSRQPSLSGERAAMNPLTSRSVKPTPRSIKTRPTSLTADGG
jgi:hypothetical protein